MNSQLLNSIDFYIAGFIISGEVCYCMDYTETTIEQFFDNDTVQINTDNEYEIRGSLISTTNENSDSGKTYRQMRIVVDDIDQVSDVVDSNVITVVQKDTDDGTEYPRVYGFVRPNLSIQSEEFKFIGRVTHIE